MSDNREAPQREKRRVSLDGQDPIEVLKRLLGKPQAPNEPEKEPRRPAS